MPQYGVSSNRSNRSMRRDFSILCLDCYCRLRPPTRPWIERIEDADASRLKIRHVALTTVSPCSKAVAAIMRSALSLPSAPFAVRLAGLAQHKGPTPRPARPQATRQSLSRMAGPNQRAPSRTMSAAGGRRHNGIRVSIRVLTIRTPKK